MEDSNEIEVQPYEEMVGSAAFSCLLYTSDAADE